jgi:hypothetical protein
MALVTIDKDYLKEQKRRAALLSTAETVACVGSCGCLACGPMHVRKPGVIIC